MQGSNVWIFGIGFLSQLFFSARILYQWIASEKAGKVLSPPAFWILSIAGSYLLFIYGVLRNDFAIILGQFISYYIYLWNLKIQGQWKKIAQSIKALLILTPIVAIGIMLHDASGFFDTFFNNKDVPLWLLIFGSAGQVIFALRFVYQFLYSAARHESTLPVGFWIISLVGSIIIISYALFRKDPVLILGQSFGFVAYIRNLMIAYKSRKITVYEE
ncbi:MAG: lipid-A-disaccharide synthase N-terminal domain-containing protein [Porphyromonadaceae bacterium]|nr:lipid-A-disaccharide synthase N-terminal domain-containing protein [Porphyromonadaceae bacterium]